MVRVLPDGVECPVVAILFPDDGLSVKSRFALFILMCELYPSIPEWMVIKIKEA